MSSQLTYPNVPPTSKSQPEVLFWRGFDPSRLDTQEIKGHVAKLRHQIQLQRVTADPHRWRHGSWTSTRYAILRAMEASAIPMSRVNAFRECGSRAWVYHYPSDPPNFRLHSCTCKDRFCVPCAKTRSMVIRENLLAKVDARTCRFLTLTIRSKNEPLPDTIDRLYRAFSDLRRLAFWKRHVSGGAAFCEITRNAKSATWHVHIHALVQGVYVPKRELQACWKACTDGSFIVDIRAIRTEKDVVTYLTKYITKPFSADVLTDHSSLVESMIALKGRRMCMTFGKWRKFPLTKLPDRPQCVPLCPLNELVALANRGVDAAQKIITELWGRRDDPHPHEGDAACGSYRVPPAPP